MPTKIKKRPILKRVRHHTRRLLVPHKGNQYRPHLVRFPGLILVLVLVLAVNAIYNSAQSGHFEVLGDSSDISIDDLVKDTNAERQKAGLGDLTLSSSLDRAAYDKAQDMFKNNYWAHVSPSGVQPWHWLAVEDYDYNSAGENLAKNYPSAGATVTAWMNSPTHRANVLNSSYKEVGFAVVSGTLEGQNTTLVVAFYADPALGNVASPVTSAPAVEGANTSSLLARLGSLVQALSPAALGTIVVLLVVVGVALATWFNRKKLPKTWQKSWRLHHGLYTTAVALLVIVILVAGTTVGQI